MHSLSGQMKPKGQIGSSRLLGLVRRALGRRPNKISFIFVFLLIFFYIFYLCGCLINFLFYVLISFYFIVCNIINFKIYEFVI